MKPLAARACARPLTAPSTMALLEQPNHARCAIQLPDPPFSTERARSRSSAGYRPATLSLDSLVGSLAACPIPSLGPTLSLGPATWVELVRLAARDRTDAAIAKPEPPFVRVDELGGQFPGMPGAPSHGQNRGLAVGAADQAPRACDSAHGSGPEKNARSHVWWLRDRESPANRTPQRYRARGHSFGPSRVSAGE